MIGRCQNQAELMKRIDSKNNILGRQWARGMGWGKGRNDGELGNKFLERWHPFLYSFQKRLEQYSAHGDIFIHFMHNS